MSDVHKSIEDEIAHLRDLDLAGLGKAWRGMFGRAVPAHFQRSLIWRVLAHRMQAEAFGDLSRTTARTLDGLGRGADGDARLVVPPGQSGLRPGTVLVREHGGERHQVTVVADGYAWKSKTYPSLTKVARAITGTNWNGPRFFGLREKR